MTKTFIACLALGLGVVLSGCTRPGFYDGDFGGVGGAGPQATDPCLSDSACRAGFACDVASGYCVEDTSATPHGSVGTECVVDANCFADLECEDGECVDPEAPGGNGGNGGGGGGNGGSAGGSSGSSGNGGGGEAGGTGGGSGTGGTGTGGTGINEPTVVVGCLSDADCGGGVCCTYLDEYESRCESEAVCTGGNPQMRGKIDACLVDAQCDARHVDQDTCCHNRLGSACGPAEFCEVLLPCTFSAECAGSEAGECCTEHPYYQQPMCTPEGLVDPGECL